MRMNEIKSIFSLFLIVIISTFMSSCKNNQQNNENMELLKIDSCQEYDNFHLKSKKYLESLEERGTSLFYFYDTLSFNNRKFGDILKELRKKFVIFDSVNLFQHTNYHEGHKSFYFILYNDSNYFYMLNVILPMCTVRQNNYDKITYKFLDEQTKFQIWQFRTDVKKYLEFISYNYKTYNKNKIYELDKSVKKFDSLKTILKR